jgi:hypothetical protein
MSPWRVRSARVPTWRSSCGRLAAIGWSPRGAGGAHSGARPFEEARDRSAARPARQSRVVRAPRAARSARMRCDGSAPRGSPRPAGSRAPTPDPTARGLAPTLRAPHPPPVPGDVWPAGRRDRPDGARRGRRFRSRLLSRFGRGLSVAIWPSTCERRRGADSFTGSSHAGAVTGPGGRGPTGTRSPSKWRRTKGRLSRARGQLNLSEFPP